MADPRIALLLALLASPLDMVLVHVVFARLQPSAQRQMLAVRAILSAGALFAMPVAWLLGASELSMQERLSSGAYAALVYLAIGYSYFHVFNLSETARRIRIMNELYDAPLTDAELLARYRPDQAFEQRIERLRSIGQLEIVDGRYRLHGGPLVWAADLVLWWRGLLGFPSVATQSARSRAD